MTWPALAILAAMLTAALAAHLAGRRADALDRELADARANLARAIDPNRPRNRRI